jgi:uncharacterized protein YdiU (UPF0061 family)
LELQLSEKESQDMMRSALDQFPIIYAQTWQKLFRAKLGLEQALDEDIPLLETLLQAMHDSRIDFTTFFRGLSKVGANTKLEDISIRNDFIDRAAIDQWFKDYIARIKIENINDEERSSRMNRVNPKFILRNHLAQHAIELAQQDDFSEVDKLMRILALPYEEQPDNEGYAKPPPPGVNPVEVSCSS